ncbi:MAG: NAD(+)/NADH kinase [Desulfitobacteriia bacterium]|jgi:NAD+ kinase
MAKVGLYVNRSKVDYSDDFKAQLFSWFEKKRWEIVDNWDQDGGQASELNFILSLGGDGTVLQAARKAAFFSIPVLGVNFGRLGFLCEVERGEIYSALEKVIKDEYTIEERMMMSATVSGQKKEFQHIVLNDVVFLKENTDSIITLQMRLSGEPVESPPADGLILATPTGSTAYSLSAGGPLVSPDVEAILITPVAAHSLSSRPMVVSCREKIEVTLAKETTCRVIFDGRQMIKLRAEETVRIEASSMKAKFIRLEGRSFPKMVREKLRDR